MRTKLIRNRNGEACEALVTLTERERALVLSHAVPMLYAPGGMGPERPTVSATVRFYGACHSDVERNLLASLEAFRLALKFEAERRDAVEAEREGFDAFPAGQFADYLRGAKGSPRPVRCPYRAAHKASAWVRGYEQAHDAVLAA